MQTRYNNIACSFKCSDFSELALQHNGQTIIIVDVLKKDLHLGKNMISEKYDFNKNACHAIIFTDTKKKNYVNLRNYVKYYLYSNYATQKFPTIQQKINFQINSISEKVEVKIGCKMYSLLLDLNLLVI